MDDQQQPATVPTEPAPEPIEARPGRRRPSRWVAGIAAATTVLALGGVGGYAVGRGVHASGGAASPQPNAALGNDWRRQQEGGATLPFGGALPGDGTQPDEGTTSTDPGTTASASQVTGLVRIVSTIGYQNGEAAGTGMVLTSDGEVVTNHHVVAGATTVTATVMSTGKTYAATVVGTDAEDDVAVLQLADATGLDTVTTDSTLPSVGDDVTAVGDANGTEDHLSAVDGEVTALDQQITTQSEGNAKGQTLTGLIEISNDVISGDSGGATYDAQGEVVGMTTAASRGGDVVGYAVPIAKVLSIADDLDSGVTSSRYAYGRPAFLGVALGDSSTTVAGAYEGTPAARAGLTEGDTITDVDGTAVSTSSELRSAIARHQPGDTLRLAWTDTTGSSHSATVTLTSGPVA
jgi:S1-C subfamily serine protease